MGVMIDLAAATDGLHRLAKVALDSGEADSIEDAMRLFGTYRLHVECGATGDPSAQAALVTAVNAGRRSFLGGVTVRGASGPCVLPPWRGVPLADVVRLLGGSVTDAVPAGVDPVSIADGPGLRAVAVGWGAGVVPPGDPLPHDPAAHVLAGVAAGALLVSEAFQRARGGNHAAGRRRVGISLWQPGSDWTACAIDGRTRLLPSSAWLIGLGNLGQAYLWALGMLPYADPAGVGLVLQDFDRLAPSNDSTSMLTWPSSIGGMKTRAMANWCEALGFRVRLVERRFEPSFGIAGDEPAVALCGVDNALARSALEDVGFGRIIEAGLGGGVSDFLALRLHTFPSRRSARDLWPGGGGGGTDVLDRPAYRRLAEGGADRCGLVGLAGRTVGAPFVGALAGALAIAELVRLANGGPAVSVLDVHLRSPDHITVVAQDDGFAFNPGVVPAG